MSVCERAISNNNNNNNDDDGNDDDGNDDDGNDDDGNDDDDVDVNNNNDPESTAKDASLPASGTVPLPCGWGHPRESHRGDRRQVEISGRNEE
ncbi:hypothetical protein AVEN_125107-1 [Araneus ventricosus]|uniref:Uncharacterized protein n=1 Tax=Araneus ventricosus TaxID=182803 RepID=A0A4Y2SU09_ARAVE|nr:hypothetical protein AVEN_125107-1 [Araneus ventricosus]